MIATSCENCALRQKQHFRQFRGNDLKFVSGMRLAQRELAPGRLLVEAGEPAKALYTLTEGWAAFCADIPGGGRRITQILLPGDLIGVRAALTGKHGRAVLALSYIRYCVLDRSLPEALAQRGGELCLALMRHLAETRVRREKMATLLGNGTPIQRLAYLFLETFARLKAIGLAAELMCPFPLRRSQIAHIVGLSEVHTSRTLAVMRKEGLIDIANNILFIGNEARLADIATSKPLIYPEGRLIL